jgi:plasmid stability protein
MKPGATSKRQLIVRDLDAELVRELKLRAARHGRSAEAEHREILRQALLPESPRKPFKDLLLAMPPVGEDSDFERIPDRGRKVDL